MAQALRCRARCDPLSDVVVHVAMDMLVIRQSIRKECQTPGMRFTEEVAVEVVPLFSPLDGPVSPQTGELFMSNSPPKCGRFIQNCVRF